MKRRIVTRMLGVVFAATLLMSVSAAAQGGGASCSLARAAGTYAVSDSGTIIGVGPTGVGLRAAVGLLTLEPSGNLKGSVTANISGDIANSSLSGTYTVASDCTGTTSFDELDDSGKLVLTATAVQVWDANMQEFRFLFTSVALPDGTQLHTVINGSARKLVP